MPNGKTANWIYFGVAVVLIGIYFTFDPTQNHLFPSCPFHSLTGLYCPGCGSQRAFHSLLHLDIQKAFSFNALFVPIGMIVGYHWFVQFYNRITSRDMRNFIYDTKFPLVILGIVLLFWILRNIPIEPFSSLAPGTH